MPNFPSFKEGSAAQKFIESGAGDKLPDGSIYRGELVGGKREGEGECVFRDGLYYRG